MNVDTRMLNVEQVTKFFGGVRALDGCSLHFEKERITGLIGPNGAGKTTLFNIVAGAYPPTSGQVRFNDDDITAVPSHLLFHRGIVRTFQIPQEFGRLTTLENLMTVPVRQTGERLLPLWLHRGRVAFEESVLQAQAEEKLRFLGLHGVRDELAQNLSGGQKKLLELGRAMMAEPDLLLLDEPGAGVNPTLLAELGDRIRTLNRERGYTICVIEHNMDLIASLCDHVFVLAEGRLLAEGSMDSIRANRQVLDAYLGGGA